MRLFFLLALIVLLNLGVFGQGKNYTCSRVAGATPLIDGKLEEAAWAHANWSRGDMVQFEPYEGKTPSQSTDFAILYDDNNLYVAIVAHDSMPHKINRQLLRRDNDAADWVGIVLDSYEDKLTGFSFAVTASGTKLDLLFTNDSDMDDTWDPVWYVKTKVHSGGWNAEIRIPYSQIRFAQKTEHHWGLEIVRHIYRNKETSVWAPLKKGTPRTVSDFGTLNGIVDIKPHKDIELFPFALGKASTYPQEQGNPFRTGSDLGASAGMDGKVSLSNQMTLNFTVNPDFGQVEADPSVVNLSAYESYFPEKRPFFIEGRNIFAFPITMGDGDNAQLGMFYSRRLGRPPHLTAGAPEGGYVHQPERSSILGAVKLSGKTKKGTSIGLLETITQKEFALTDQAGNQSRAPVEPFSNYAVARVAQDLDSGNAVVGVLLTGTYRDLDAPEFKILPSSAYTGAVNITRYWHHKDYLTSLKLMASSVQGSPEAMLDLQTNSTHYFQRPDAGYLRVDSALQSLKGYGLTLDLAKTGGKHWQSLNWLTLRSPALDFNDLGFMPQADEIQHVSWVGYNEFKPGKYLNQYSIGCAYYEGWNFGGQNVYRGVNININVTLRNFYHLFLHGERQGEALSSSDLRGGPMMRQPGQFRFHGGFDSDSRKKLTFGLFAYTRQASHNHAHSEYFEAWMGYKPFNAMSLNLYSTYDHTVENLQYVETFSTSNGSEYLLARLNSRTLAFSFRADVSITPDLSIQFYGQPFVFSGDYTRFKLVGNPMATEYSSRFRELTDAEMAFQPGANSYMLDANQDGNSDFTLDNPDFHFLQFKSNLVLRWEYKPGSVWYLVWGQGRTGSGTDGRFRPEAYNSELWRIASQNDFICKISYAFIF